VLKQKSIYAVNTSQITAMKVAEEVQNKLSLLVVETANEIHREEYFTAMLFAHLWPIYGKRLLFTSGLGLAPLLSQIKGSTADLVRQKHLPGTKDFYADLIITAPLSRTDPSSTMGIDHFLPKRQITHLYEFKYLTSFPTLSRKHAREDTYKLQILGEYVFAVSGVRPYLEQFVMLTNRPAKRTHTIKSLQGWFMDEEIQAKTPDVCVTLVDTFGNLHKGKTRESRTIA
jgi:hypothetical protein